MRLVDLLRMQSDKIPEAHLEHLKHSLHAGYWIPHTLLNSPECEDDPGCGGMC